MRYVIFRFIFIGCVVSCLANPGMTQTLNWDINLSKPETFTSLNPVDDPDVAESQMWQVSMKDLMALGDRHNGEFGIGGVLKDDRLGFAKVSVYLYDSANITPDVEGYNGGRGPMIFQAFMDKSNAGIPYADKPEKYTLGSWMAWWPSASEDTGGFYFNDYWQSTDAWSAALAAAFYNYNSKFTGWNEKLSPGRAVIPYSYLNTDLKLPVIIEVTIFKANVETLSLPGLGIVEPSYFKPPYLDAQGVITNVSANSIKTNINISKPNLSPGETSVVSALKLKVGVFGQTSSPIDSMNIDGANLPYSKNGLAMPLGQVSPGGQYWLWAEYSISIRDNYGRVHKYTDQRQFLANFGYKDIYSYNVTKTDYKGLPVFSLSGGMSAEYGVEKSLASLSSGISETWDVRMVNGQPDLVGGGPVSVYPETNTFNFLQRSVQKTVQLYNDNLGPTTPINTVIIGTGTAQVPYLSNAMKAAFLPLHFLVSVHSVAEIKRILDTAGEQGYSAFSMAGYDPSIGDAGVAWIKLTRLPPEYIQFLRDHKVQNVIIMGYKEGAAGGEAGARRIWIEGQPDDDFTDGSMYMMGFGELKTYKDLFKDFYRWNFGQEKILVDWEGGVTNNQIENVSGQASENSINSFTIQSGGSFNFYQWGLDIQLAAISKNKERPVKVSLNEYLIGYPEYELYTNTVPYLYWQGLAAGQIAFNTYDFAQFKLQNSYNGLFKNIPVYIQAKANRSKILDSLKNYFTDVTMDSWQKADVWNPADGMNSPCELVAEAITKDPNGAQLFAEWNNKRAVLDFDDFTQMARNSIRPAPPANPNLFPMPSNVRQIEKLDEAGLTITKYQFDPNTYWQPLNFPNQIELRATGRGFPGISLGFLDGQLRPADIRKQAITIAEFDIGNQKYEYDLQMGYKFNVTDKDGLLSYDPKLGDEQNMDCFEFTSIPFNHWFDIPSRMMARAGAVWIVNGGVYDFDYNGLPGVVPFIKKNDEIKAQPQILSFKGEGAFAWNWLDTPRKVAILGRPRDVPSTGLPGYMKTLFRDSTKPYHNVMGAMTYMIGVPGRGLYDINALQPNWMKNYPPFPEYYLERDNRCFFAPLSLKCTGTEVVAPIDQGFNNCESLQSDSSVQRFSALAYQQYQNTFDDVANARTFIGIKGRNLDIGIIDGDYGKRNYRGPYLTKSLGMHVYEESQFCLAKGYDYFVNLDGGSSTQMWVNGRGPLQMLNSYVLRNDNQGPYYSRLVSSYIMLVPKFHMDQVRQKVIHADLNTVPILDNTKIEFDYSDAVDLEKPKAFIDLSPCKESLNRVDGNYGLIAGDFVMSERNASKNGGVLFYAGEDMYYPETKGLYAVKPRLRNLMVIGVGRVPPSLVDSLLNLGETNYPPEFGSLIGREDMSAYYVKVYDGKVIEFILERDGKNKYLIGNHRFLIRSDGNASPDKYQNIIFMIDGRDIVPTITTWTYLSHSSYGFLNIGTCTHAYIGAVNLDGRFITGDIAMKVFNYLFVVGADAWDIMDDNTQTIDRYLEDNELPDFGDDYYDSGIYALQCLETSGQHVFALSPRGMYAEKPRFYGLRLNNYLFKQPQSHF